jgi:hypothetical protein
MTWLKTILDEGYGLFVDDGSFAVAILLWIAVTWLISWTSIAPGEWSGIILFIGLALILLGSTTRRARRRPDA